MIRLPLLLLLLALPASAARVDLQIASMAAPEVPWTGTGALGVGGFRGWEPARLSSAILEALADGKRGLPVGFKLPDDPGSPARPNDLPVVPPARLDGPLGATPGSDVSRWAEVREQLGGGVLVTGMMEVPEADDIGSAVPGSVTVMGPLVCTRRVVRSVLRLRVLDASSGQARLERELSLLSEMERCGRDRAQAEVGFPPTDVIAHAGIPDLAKAVADLVAPRWVVHRIVLERTGTTAKGVDLLRAGRFREAAGILLAAADGNPGDGPLQVAAAVALAATNHHPEARRRIEVALILDRKPAWEKIAGILEGIAREADRLRRMGLAVYPAHLAPAASR